VLLCRLQEALWSTLRTVIRRMAQLLVFAWLMSSRMLADGAESIKRTSPGALNAKIVPHRGAVHLVGLLLTFCYRAGASHHRPAANHLTLDFWHRPITTFDLGETSLSERSAGAGLRMHVN